MSFIVGRLGVSPILSRILSIHAVSDTIESNHGYDYSNAVNDELNQADDALEALYRRNEKKVGGTIHQGYKNVGGCIDIPRPRNTRGGRIRIR
jgi:hypothetical protein